MAQGGEREGHGGEGEGQREGNTEMEATYVEFALAML